MINTEVEELGFYKNGSAQTVLERFKFTDEEKKLVQDAIRTASMPKPRMKLIQEADVLLKEVAKNREPIIPLDVGTKVPYDAITNIELLKINNAMKQTELSIDKNTTSFFNYTSKSVMSVVILLIVAVSIVQYYNK